MVTVPGHSPFERALDDARCGRVRPLQWVHQGTAVLIYVTEVWAVTTTALRLTPSEQAQVRSGIALVVDGKRHPAVTVHELGSTGVWVMSIGTTLRIHYQQMPERGTLLMLMISRHTIGDAASPE